MAVKILVHGFGQRASSWKETISYLQKNETVLCPNLSSILSGKPAAYPALYAAFAEYCGKADGQLHLCGISLGGILALNYALDFPQKIKTLVLIGTPCKITRVMLGIQTVLFHFFPKSAFTSMAFDKTDAFALVNSMKDLDFSGRVHQIQCPTLVLCGNKDRTNLKSAYYLSRHIPNAELRLVAHSGHVVNEEQPNALASMLTEHCAKYP